MRARNLVFHVNCFCCNVCHTPLTKGDQYGIIDASIYCRCVVQAGVGESNPNYTLCIPFTELTIA